MALNRPSLIDCFQADVSGDKIWNDSESLLKGRFRGSDSSDNDPRNVSTSSRISTSKSRPKGIKRFQPDDTQSRPKNRKVQEQLVQFLENGSDYEASADE